MHLTLLLLVPLTKALICKAFFSFSKRTISCLDFNYLYLQELKAPGTVQVSVYCISLTALFTCAVILSSPCKGSTDPTGQAVLWLHPWHHSYHSCCTHQQLWNYQASGAERCVYATATWGEWTISNISMQDTIVTHIKVWVQRHKLWIFSSVYHHSGF